MEKIDIVIIAIVIGFGIVITLLSILWNVMREMRKEMRDLTHDIHDIEQPLCHIEGSVSVNDCTVFKKSKSLGKTKK